MVCVPLIDLILSTAYSDKLLPSTIFWDFSIIYFSNHLGIEVFFIAHIDRKLSSVMLFQPNFIKIDHFSQFNILLHNKMDIFYNFNFFSFGISCGKKRLSIVCWYNVVFSFLRSALPFAPACVVVCGLPASVYGAAFPAGTPTVFLRAPSREGPQICCCMKTWSCLFFSQLTVVRKSF